MQRTALVTGGTRGIGGAIAISLREAGHRVAVVYPRDGDMARRFTESTSLPACRWKVADFHARRHGVLELTHDISPVEILVNNAGVTADAMPHRMTPEQWSNVVQINPGSLFNMSRNVIESVRQRHVGRIVSISSINGQQGQLGQTGYAASKAGVLGFTKALARESASANVTVNAIAPGYCDTDMVAGIAGEILQNVVSSIPVGRLGLPAEVGRLAAFLAAENAADITGATVDVNGGQSMRQAQPCPGQCWRW